MIELTKIQELEKQIEQLKSQVHVLKGQELLNILGCKIGECVYIPAIIRDVYKTSGNRVCAALEIVGEDACYGYERKHFKTLAEIKLIELVELPHD